MKIQAFGISDKGLVREHNEDNFLLNEEEKLFAVADGMGGLAKGDVASKIAVESINDFVVRSRSDDITWPIKPQDDYSMEENRFLAAISMANWKIYTEFQRDETNKTPMGTTIVGFLQDRDQLIMANVGDSRGYRVRNNEIIQLTDDHSLVMDEVRRGNMTLEEARNHPQRHVINRALGISESIQVDISTIDIDPNDIYLLCSDGLSDLLTDDEILEHFKSEKGNSLEPIANRLIETAKNYGGKDNITVLLIAILE